MICFDDTPTGVRCEVGHFTCADCLGTLVQVKANDLKTMDNLHLEAASAVDAVAAKVLAGFIFCPCRGAGGCLSEQPFAEAAIAKTASPDAFAEYVLGRSRLPAANESSKAFEEAQSALQQELAALRADGTVELGGQLLAKQLATEMPGAVQCAECGFGPIDHFACSDLSAHHGQQIGNSRIDNSCPKCGWFSADSADWPAWDGRLHGDAIPDVSEAKAMISQENERTVREAAEAKANAEAALTRAEAARDEAISSRRTVEARLSEQRSHLLSMNEDQVARAHRERNMRVQAEAAAEQERAHRRELEAKLAALERAQRSTAVEQAVNAGALNVAPIQTDRQVAAAPSHPTPASRPSSRARGPSEPAGESVRGPATRAAAPSSTDAAAASSAGTGPRSWPRGPAESQRPRAAPRWQPSLAPPPPSRGNSEATIGGGGGAGMAWAAGLPLDGPLRGFYRPGEGYAPGRSQLGLARPLSAPASNAGHLGRAPRATRPPSAAH